MRRQRWKAYMNQHSDSHIIIRGGRFPWFCVEVLRMRIDWVEYVVEWRVLALTVLKQQRVECVTADATSLSVVIEVWKIWRDRGTSGDAFVVFECVLFRFDVIRVCSVVWCTIWCMMWCDAMTGLTGWYEAVKYDCSELDIGIVDIGELWGDESRWHRLPIERL